ncbi:MAG: hypothetical protein HQL56_13635 [Magnetococcales bacterium]|nr:hypothetical protein [Magnetococcales bacterium]
MSALTLFLVLLTGLALQMLPFAAMSFRRHWRDWQAVKGRPVEADGSGR